MKHKVKADMQWTSPTFINFHSFNNILKYEKTSHRLAGNILRICILQRTDSYPEYIKNFTILQRIQTNKLKMGKRSEQTFHQKNKQRGREKKKDDNF